MSSTDTKQLIAQALERLEAEVPPLRQLKLAIKLELRARGGGDVPIWRIEVPGPTIERDPGGEARIEVSLARSHFNALAVDGRLRTGSTPTSAGTSRSPASPP